jgi:DNA-binding transcriptional ArsR family regulator
MGTDFAAVARLLANPARSAVVDALQAGRPLAAGELARLAGVRPSTISEHLAVLVEGGLLAVVNAGRHRYYRLANTAVAEALEALSHICPATPVRSLRQSNAARSFKLARTCYDHLAGALAVALLDAMLDRDWLIDDNAEFAVTSAGAAEFSRLGVDVAACRRARRQFARPCLDWTQRRMHLAGALGAAITTALITRDWLRPDSADRGVRITATGETGLRATFSIDTATLGWHE